MSLHFLASRYQFKISSCTMKCYKDAFFKTLCPHPFRRLELSNIRVSMEMLQFLLTTLLKEFRNLVQNYFCPGSSLHDKG